jgi:NADH-quinone oxidoreductase subunit J
MEKLAYAAFGFYLVLIIAGALAAVAARSLVRALMGLIMTLFGVAGMYFLMAAPFLALMQILIYVGAVSVLIFFAIMLTRAPEGEAGTEPALRFAGRKVSAILCGLMPTVILGGLLIAKAPQAMALKPEVSLLRLGEYLSGPSMLAFELIAVVLLAAMAGAVMLGFERRKG